MTDPYTALCKYCGQQFTATPEPRKPHYKYCPQHRGNYHHRRMHVGQAVVHGYQDIKPTRQFLIPKQDEPLKPNIPSKNGNPLVRVHRRLGGKYS